MRNFVPLDAPRTRGELVDRLRRGEFLPASVCPPIRQYDREFQRKLADEIESAPANAAFSVALQDYTLLRMQIQGSCN